MSSEAGEAAALCQAASDTIELSPPIVDLLLEDLLPFLSHTSVMLDAKSTVFLAILKMWGQEFPSFKGTRGSTQKRSLFCAIFFQINDQLHLQSKTGSCHHKSDLLMIDRHKKLCISL